MSPQNPLKVTTTLPILPLPPNSARTPPLTPRLLIRALTPSDLPALHTLRTQPEVMINNPQGRPDPDISRTSAVLANYLAPNDTKTFNFAICLRETGEMIGIGGCHSMQSIYGWPVLGYQLRKEYWGRGLATEFVGAWLGLWRGLERGVVEVVVDGTSVVMMEEGEEGEGKRAREVMSSFTVGDNVASMRVLEKSGFERFGVRRERDLRDQRREVDIVGFRFFC